MNLLVWLGIGFCITQSAIFSGLNLAFFSISKLRLQVEASKGSRQALKVLSYRNDSNFLLTTILWGNVGINVLLTLLSRDYVKKARGIQSDHYPFPQVATCQLLHRNDLFALVKEANP